MKRLCVLSEKQTIYAKHLFLNNKRVNHKILLTRS